MTATEREAAVPPQLTPLEQLEHQLNVLLSDLSTVEERLGKLPDSETVFDAVLACWGARKQLRKALECVQLTPE